jgi:hypothetical protein
MCPTKIYINMHFHVIAIDNFMNTMTWLAKDEFVMV